MEMDKDESIHVSNELWYMLVAGYILPICGILTFFIVTYYWVQEFPIGICIDVMSCVLLMPGPDDIIKKIAQPDEEELEKRSKIDSFIRLADLKLEFKGLRDTSWGSKAFYPFSSPQTAVLSVIYAVLQAVFVILAFRIFRDNVIGILFCLFAGSIGFIANFYVFSIAFIWTWLFTIILLAIAVVIAIAIAGFGLICIACLLWMCFSTENDNR